jgi:Sigma-54 interaction domain
MSVETAKHVLLDSCQTELGILRKHPSNLLLEGPAAATDAVLLLLQPHLREPLVSNPPDSPFELPETTTGGLILRDVAALSACEQARLLVWLQGEGFGVQVVSTTERPLFALVAQGLFDAALYYRLNVFLLRVEPASSSGSQEQHAPLARGPERKLAEATHGG